jgi:hypothetical protein
VFGVTSVVKQTKSPINAEESIKKLGLMSLLKSSKEKSAIFHTNLFGKILSGNKVPAPTPV